MGLFENRVYPGIPELLVGLQERGFHLFLATSKPRVFAERILEHFQLNGFFEAVLAMNSTATLPTNPRWCGISSTPADCGRPRP